MKLRALIIDGHHVDIRPAPVERAWMEATGDRFAYRCLPLSIANSHGWEILCSGGFVARWNGGPAKEAIKIFGDPDATIPAVSHFGHGILTFHIPCLFRTEPGFDLLVQGPINRPKDAIAPLSGIVETEWSPYSFTMNWQFTRSGTAVRFDKGEPICQFWPIRRGELESIEPTLELLSAEPELKGRFDEWNNSRLQFNADLRQSGSRAQIEKWQKLYHQGMTPDGQEFSDHRTRLRVRPFKADTVPTE